MSAINIYHVAKAISAKNEYFKRRKENFEQGDELNLDELDLGAAGALMGLSIGILLIIFLILTALWVTGLVLLIKHWSTIPVWARWVGVLGLGPFGFIPFGPVATIFVVLATKGDQTTNFASDFQFEF